MENTQIKSNFPNPNIQNYPNLENTQIQIHPNPPQGSKEKLQSEKNLQMGIVQVTKLLANQQSTTGQFQKFDLNIRITQFLQHLACYNKLKIVCHLEKCVACCRPCRSHQVIGINEKGREYLIMTASQEALQCVTSGYMLVYKTNNVIIGSLGYLQILHVPVVVVVVVLVAVKVKAAVLIVVLAVCAVTTVAKMVVVLEEDVAQRKHVAVVVKMDVVLEDAAPFVIVVASKEVVAMSHVVQKDVVLVLIIKKFY